MHLASFCGCLDWVLSYLVNKPKDRFSQKEAHQSMLNKLFSYHRCPRYSYLPPQCHLIKDPANPCCFKPACDFPISVGQLTGHYTPAPSPGVSTNAPQSHPSLPGSKRTFFLSFRHVQTSSCLLSLILFLWRKNYMFS